MNLLEKIGKSFDKHAKTYEQHAVFQNESQERLLERLQYFKIEPKRILDLGSGTGRLTKALKKRFPKALVVASDLSMGMLKIHDKKQGFFTRWPRVLTDMHALPFMDESFDLIIANQVMHWSYDYQTLLAELNRVLNIDGCLLFSTLGPDTFIELKHAFSGVDAYAHTHDFFDMHDVGDMLTRSLFADAVMDMEPLTLCYPSVKDVLLSLKAQGFINTHTKQLKGLMGVKRWHHFIKAYEAMALDNGKIPLGFELVFGHAWKTNIKKKDSSTVLVSEIKRIT